MLRQHYLTADMGVSGGNFFVAETGSVVLVTNEGNATLSTTLPRVHVAISGIEKIVPTLEDVATLMRLLPRSATGQSISNYVDVYTGPKGEGEFHGAEHMYFIVVDSGRTGILGSEVREALRCIRCGACMNHCPVYQNVGGHSYGWVYPGPIGSILTPMYVGLEQTQDLPAASTLCNQCGVVCPVMIPLPDLQRKLREQAFARGLRPWTERAALRAWAFVAARPRLYALATRIGVRVMRAIAGREGRIHRLPVGAGWTDGRDLAGAGRAHVPRALPRAEGAMSATRDPHAHGAAALPPRRIARHRERVRRAGRGQRARARRPRRRLVLHRAARLPDAEEHPGGRGSRRSAPGGTATRRRPASTSSAPRSPPTSARGAACRSRPEDVVVGAGAKPFIAYTIASVTDYGAGDEVIYPVPGFPIYESQILANGAVPVPLYLREARDFAFDPAELEAKITPKTRLVILNTPHNPTGGILRGADLDAIAAILADHPQVWVFADEVYSRLGLRRRLRVARRAAGNAGAHGDLRRRVEDLGDDRLAHRLRRQPRARAGVHALDHQHRLLRVADLAVGGAGGGDRAAGRGRRDAGELPRAPRPHRRPAERGAGHQLPRRPAARSTRGRTSPRRAGSPAAPDSEAFRKRLLHEAGVAVLADIHFGRRVPGDGQHIRFSYAASPEAIREGVDRLDRFVRDHMK